MPSPATVLGTAARFGAVGLLYFAAGTLGLGLAEIHESTSPVWPGTGVAIGALLVMGLRLWPAVAVGAFAFNLNSTGELATSAAIAIGNTLEAVVAVVLVRRFANGTRAFDSVPDALRYALLAGVIAPQFSATIGVTSLTVAGSAPLDGFMALWVTWWLGDMGGALLVAPLIVLWATPRAADRRLRPAEAALMLGAVLGAAAVVFYGEGPPGPLGQSLPVLLLGLLLWPALRAGPRETSLAVFVIAVVAVHGTVSGTGPFAAGPVNESLLLLQVFLAVTATSAMALAAFCAMPDEAAGPVPWRAITLAAIVLVGVLGSAVVGASVTRAAADDLARGRYEEHAGQVVAHVSDTLASHVDRLDGAKGLFEASPATDRRTFHEYVLRSGWLTGAKGVAFARIVEAADLAAYESAVRNGTGPDADDAAPFTVRPKGSGTHYVVEFIEPRAGNEAAIGFDLGSEASRRAAVLAAIDSGAPAATRPLTLVQETGSARAILIMRAVYLGGDPGSAAMRRASAFGIVDSAHRIPDIVATVTAALAPRLGPLDIEIYEDAPDALMGPGGWHRATLVYDSDTEASFDPAAPAAATLLHTIPVYGQQWTMFVGRPAGLRTTAEDAAPWTILAAGGVASTMLAAIVYQNEATRRRAVARAAEVTSRLSDSEARFRALADGAVDGIMVANRVGLIEYANPAAGRLFGYGPDDLRGRSIVALLPGTFSDVADGDFVAFLRNKRQHLVGRTTSLEGMRRDGSPVAIQGSFTTWDTGRGPALGAVVRPLLRTDRAPAFSGAGV